MKHLLLILISFLLLSSPVIGDNHKRDNQPHFLYRWEDPSGDGYVWKRFGEKDTHPKYTGEVDHKGKPEGLGYLIYPKGSDLGDRYSDLFTPKRIKYVGEYKDGLRNGKGTLTWTDGKKYVGEFKDGKKWNGTEYDKNGNIIQTWIYSGKYEGEYIDGIPNGKGTLTYPNGDKYVGEWKDGKRNGQGTFNFSDGEKYVGEWKNGEKNGQGTYTFHDGGKYVGEFKDGKQWNGTEYDKDGKIISKYVNGKGQK